MQQKSLIKTTAYVVGTIWSLAVALNGLQLSGTSSKVLGFIPLLLVLIFTVWDKWLWHRRPLRYVAQTPVLGGTWFGHFDSQWIDDEGETRETTSRTALVIKQSFTQLSITLLAEKSKSYSILSSVQPLPSGEFRINYQYANTPKLKFRQQMPPHAGSTELTISDISATEMTGEYWTNRMSRGTLTLVKVSKKRVSNLDEAETLSVDGGN